MFINKMQLKDKFISSFLSIMLSAILTTIIVSIILLYRLNTNLSDNEEIIEIFKNNSYRSSIPTILSGGTIISKTFQPLVYELKLIEEYFKLYHLNNDLFDFEDRNKMIKFIDEHSYNSYILGTKFNIINNEIQNKNMTNPYYYATFITWYINRNKIDLESLSLPQIQLIYTSCLLGSVYYANLNTRYPSLISEDINQFLYVDSHDLFVSYPLYLKTEKYDLKKDYNPLKDTKNLYKIFISFNNPSSCTTKEIETPDYYYAPCRDWYIQSENQFHLNGKTIVITNPYSYKFDGTLGVTICNRFIHKGLKVNSCTDIVKDKLFATLDQLNKLLEGYFFIMLVDNQYPFYYPEINSNQYLLPLIKHEFDLNVTYYTKELDDYEAKMGIFSKYNPEYNRNINFKEPLYEDSFEKNGEKISFTLFPLTLYDQVTETEYRHYFNIIFIHMQNASQSLAKSAINRQFLRIILQMILLIILSLVVLFFTSFLIVNLAEKIVAPIKSLKIIVKDLQAKNKDKESNIDLEKNNEMDEIENIGNEEDENIQVRSEQIDYIFNLLLKLKKVMSFTTTGTILNAEEAFLDYIFAKKVFEEINNIKGKDICESNLGIIALKLEKYDKAVLHLKESTSMLKGYFPKSLYDNNKFISLKDKKYKNSKASKQDKEKLETIKTNFIDSRYPKLINSFRMYFDEIKQLINVSNSNDNEDINEEKSFCVDVELENYMSTSKKIDLDKSYEFSFKSQNIGSNSNNNNMISNLPNSLKNEFKEKIKEMREIINTDLFTQNESHSLNIYHCVLKEYLYLCINNGKLKQIIESCVEYNDFLIEFKLKDYSSVFNIYHNKKKKKKNNPNIITLDKLEEAHVENLIETIYSNFLIIDKYMEQIKQTINMEYIRNFNNIIRNSNSDTKNDYVEIPIFVLNARLNYVKGKYFECIGHIKNAYFFYCEAYNISIISDIRLTYLSGKAIMNLLKFSTELLNYEKNYIENANFYEQKNLNYILLLGDFKSEKENKNKEEENITNVDNNDEENKEVNESKNVSIKSKVSGVIKKGVSVLGINKNNIKNDPNMSILIKLKHLDKNLMLTNIKNNIKLITEEIEGINSFINLFTYESRDIIVMLDNRIKKDSKKIDQAEQVIRDILNKQTSNTDRFSYAIYQYSLNLKINLNFKTRINHNYLNNEITDSMNKDTSIEGEDVNILKCLLKAMIYMNSKSFKNREKWVIILSETIDNEQIESMESAFKSKVFKNLDSEIYNIVLISFTKASHIKDSYYNKIKTIFESAADFKSALFVAFDEVDIVKNMMKSIGKISKNSFFPLEKFYSKS